MHTNTLGNFKISREILSTAGANDQASRNPSKGQHNNTKSSGGSQSKGALDFTQQVHTGVKNHKQVQKGRIAINNKLRVH